MATQRSTRLSQAGIVLLKIPLYLACGQRIRARCQHQDLPLFLIYRQEKVMLSLMPFPSKACVAATHTARTACINL